MRMPVLVVMLAFVVPTAAGCADDQPAVSDATDACAVFGRLLVDRDERTVPQSEVESRLARAVRAARKAADKEARWLELERKLEDLRDQASDAGKYDELEGEIWTICAPYVGT